jgi:NADPH2:quinone reductase
MVVQLAKAAGARVLATGGTDEKVKACLELGADVAINYRTENVTEAIERFSPGGVDVFWETSREPDFETIVPALAERGRIVLMAGRDARPTFPVGPFYVKGCRMHGFVMFKATPDEQRRCAEAINQYLATGTIRAQVGRVLPLSRAAEAHRLQEENTLQAAGTLAGKIVLTT